MRLLIVEPGPSFSVQDVHRGWLSGFKELGVTVASLNLNDRLDFYGQVAVKRSGRWKPALTGDEAIQVASKGLHAAAYEFWPDVIVFTSCFFVPAATLDLLRSRGHKIVLLLTESPYEDSGQMMRAAHADVCVLNDPTNLDRFRDICPNTYYQPHSYNPKMHARRPARPEFVSDVAFVGTAFESRIKFLEAVDWSGIDLFLGGNWTRLTDDSPLRKYVAHPIEHCIDNTETVDAYSSTRASFNVYRVEGEAGSADGWACGPREIELAACATWFARDPRPESDELFPMLPTFDTPQELEALLRWALDNDDKCAEAAAQARAAIADRTFVNAASRLLHLLDAE